MNPTTNPLTFNPRSPKIQVQQRKQRNYQHLKPTYETMNWKNYTINNNRPRNISVQDLDRLSAKNSIRQYHSPSYYDAQQYFDTNQNNASNLSGKKIREQNLRLSGVTYNSKRQEHAVRVKQDALRRVKMLQQKVLPLITSERSNPIQDQNEEYGFGWQMKMQQKLVKIQNSIQRVKNEMEIKYEKRLMQIERHWQGRISQLLEIVGMRNNTVYTEVDNGLLPTTQTNQQPNPPHNINRNIYNYYQSRFANNNAQQPQQMQQR